MVIENISVFKYKIITIDDTPVNTKEYRYLPLHKNVILGQSSDLSKNEAISQSHSAFNFPAWVVPKKADSSTNKRWRMVIH